MSDANLVTTCNFNGREYFIKMTALNNVLELILTDKQTGEDWQCCYDAAYIEGVTQKTGNFKQFDIFIAMLKSGLLKTSKCIYLDLMTFDDLDALRNQRVRRPFSAYHMAQTNNNRRYLILTYTVEFDRIHYPVPLEYCGPPDPQILQQHIIRLENEISQLKEQKYPNKSKNDTKMVMALQKRVDDLTEENRELHEEIQQLKQKNPRQKINMLQNAIKSLEKSVLLERKSHHQLVAKLKSEKTALTKEIDRLKCSERILRSKVQTCQITRERPLKRMSDPGGRGETKSRSQSPRICRSENWEGPLQTKTMRKKIRKKSRSGSESSEKHEDDYEINLRRTSRLKHIRKNLKDVSRSHSASSASRESSPSAFDPERNSYLSPNRANSREHSRTPQRVCSRNSDLDFSSLETRIQALQKMLHTNLTLHENRKF